MKSLDHLSVLALDHKVQAVLSVNESSELLAVTLAGSPVSPGEWKVMMGYGDRVIECRMNEPMHEFMNASLHMPVYI